MEDISSFLAEGPEGADLQAPSHEVAREVLLIIATQVSGTTLFVLVCTLAIGAI